MIVRRSHVVSDALRRMDKAFFDPRKLLHVRFAMSSQVCCIHVPVELGYIYYYLIVDLIIVGVVLIPFPLTPVPPSQEILLCSCLFSIM